MKKIIIIAAVGAIMLALIGGAGTTASSGLSGIGQRIQSGAQVLLTQGPGAAWSQLSQNFEAFGWAIKNKTGV